MFIVILSVRAQNSLDWDIDTIFDEQESSPEEAVAETNTKTNTDTKTNTKTPTENVTVKQLIQRRGMQFTSGYRFDLGLAPGWYLSPWEEEWKREDYYLDRAIKMRGTFGIDAQISESFRAKSDVYFDIPGFAFILGDFFFDYKIFDTVFLRGGKYNLSWGISPNYHFTNLLARIPKGGSARDSFIFKADVPIDRGGLQLLALTRFNLMYSYEMPKLEDFGFGGKYNLALRQVDLNFGIFYQEGMVMRGFLSAKTTLWKTELYSEALFAIDIHETSNLSGAWNIGFGRDFFNRKFSANGELFYNAEQDTYWYHPETNLREAGTSPFIEGFNIALNLTYRPWNKGNPRLFWGLLYAPSQKSARLIPGFRVSPLNNIDFYFAVPMSVGDKDGYYFKNTYSTAVQNKHAPLPFAVVFMITLSGRVQLAHYY
jgi:hypothetical protein